MENVYLRNDINSAIKFSRGRWNIKRKISGLGIFHRVATILESPGIRKRSWKVLECPGISLIFAESPGKVLEFYTAPSMSFSNSRTFQDCGKCYIIFYIAVVYFSILICHFVLVTPCYITCWKNSVFLFFAYSGVSKSPGKSWNF